jgi:hypothetical protein
MPEVIITPEMVEQDLSKFYYSRSATILSKLYQGFVIGDDLYKQLNTDIDYAMSLFKKLPDDFLQIKEKLARSILVKSPNRISSLLEFSRDNNELQSFIFDIFENRENPK